MAVAEPLRLGRRSGRAGPHTRDRVARHCEKEKLHRRAGGDKNPARAPSCSRTRGGYRSSRRCASPGSCRYIRGGRGRRIVALLGIEWGSLARFPGVGFIGRAAPRCLPKSRSRCVGPESGLGRRGTIREPFRRAVACIHQIRTGNVARPSGRNPTLYTPTARPCDPRQVDKIAATGQNSGEPTRRPTARHRTRRLSGRSGDHRIQTCMQSVRVKFGWIDATSTAVRSIGSRT